MRISWSSISYSVSVPWNNTRLAVTESCLLLCQYRLQVSIHLPALINYTSQWQITPHSFVCSHMHGNKRTRYQGKLIYSDEDGVPNALSEINACTQCHRPSWQLSLRSILSVALLYGCLFTAMCLSPSYDLSPSINHQSNLICLHISTTWKAVLFTGPMQKTALMGGLRWCWTDVLRSGLIHGTVYSEGAALTCQSRQGVTQATCLVMALDLFLIV